MKRLSLPAIAVMALILPATLGAQTADAPAGASGWAWSNPQPQGNTLRALDFAGAHGYAAGDFGTLLRTDDGGRTWTGLQTGVTGDLARLRAVDGDTVVVADGRALLRADDAGASFRRIVPVPAGEECPDSVAAFHFGSEQLGTVLFSNGAVTRTADGGQTFVNLAALPGTAAAGVADGSAAPTDIVFTGENTGFATVSGPQGGAVYRTTDGGRTWFERTTDANGLNSLHFADPSVGYAVGSANTVVKTENGGETWERRGVADGTPQDDLTSIRCASSNLCLIATASGERLLRTRNGGGEIEALDPSPMKMRAAAFSGPSTAVGVGERGATVLSTNAGARSPAFVPVGEQPLPGSFRRVRATSASLVYAPGDSGRVARSTDGGRTWRVLQVPTSEDLVDAWFLDESTGFVLDASGTVLKTTNRGASWGPLESSAMKRPRALYAIDQNLVLLLGGGGILRTADGGATPFAAVAAKPVRASSFIDYDRTEGPALFAYGTRKIVVTSDRGATWRRVPGPVRKPRYRAVDFVTGKLGYALMGDGRLFVTRNTGASWSERRSTGTERGTHISFGDARNGFMVVPGAWGGESGDVGWVLRTSDGGASWRPQFVEPQPLKPRGVAAASDTTAFALAGGSDLFFTGSGGDAGSETRLTLGAAPRRTSRPARVRISGRLHPTLAGARVAVFARPERSAAWRVVGTPAVNADGIYEITTRIRSTTLIAAQWRGDADHAGDGTSAIKVRVRRRR